MIIISLFDLYQGCYNTHIRGMYIIAEIRLDLHQEWIECIESYQNNHAHMGLTRHWWSDHQLFYILSHFHETFYAKHSVRETAFALVLSTL